MSKSKSSSRRAPVVPMTSESLADTDWETLNRDIEGCQRCPRLSEHCQRIAAEKRRAYRDEPYWGRPVPNLVSPSCQPSDASGRRSILIVGLAPGAHGANRTGRMFTGDRSGDWLYRALHKAGVATQAASVDRGDGLQLRDAVITAVCHCAPPDNKPQTAEIENCRPFLERTLTMARPQVILALGQLAWSAVVKLSRTSPGMFSRPGLASVPVAPQMGQVGAQGTEVPRDRAATQFGHGRVLNLGAVSLVGCYHPSQQNTFTKRLTEAMLDDVIRHVVRLAAADSVADNVERPHR